MLLWWRGDDSLIIKPYSPSKYVARMSELVERLSPQHPHYAKISKEIGAIKAGDYGEEIVYKELAQMKIPYECYIFTRCFSLRNVHLN